MSAYKILILEDEALIARNIELSLTQLGYQVVARVQNIGEATKVLAQQHFDIALVDINLDDRFEGLEFGKMLSKENIPFVYLTSYSDKDTLAKAFKTEPDSYLVKPVNANDLHTAIELVMHRIKKKPVSKNEDSNIITLTDNNKKTFINTDDIYWIKSDKMYVEIETAESKYIERATFSSILEQVNNENIIQIHRSWAINVRFISEIQSNEVRIKNKEIPVSRSYRKELKSKVFK